MKGRPRLAITPPCDVTDRTEVELRLAVPGADGARVTIAVGKRTVVDETLPPGHGGERLVRGWFSTAGQVGRHRVRWTVARGERRETGEASVTVHASPTVGQAVARGAWIEPGAALRVAPDDRPASVERAIRDSVDAMHSVGIQFLILAYVEAGGTFYAPLSIRYPERGTGVPLPGGGRGEGQVSPVDVYEIVLSQASKRGMGVYVGMSRGGDLHLLWEFDKPGWGDRLAAALEIGRTMARELHTRYGHHRSFIGWYPTHEVNDLARAAAFYDPIAIACRELAPERTVLVAPAGTPMGSKEILARSEADIFCWQDAVGSGYVPFENTWKPERRIAMLEEIFTRYRTWHEGSRKHMWTDLEFWEMDGKSGYANPYPPEFSRVRRQLEIEARFAPVLTAYAWHGYLHPPGAPGRVDPRARTLFSAYDAYRKGLG